MNTCTVYLKNKTFVEWAKETLSAQEFASFQTIYDANEALWSTYQSQGLVRFETVYRQAFSNYLNTSIDVPIYKQMIMTDGVTYADIPDHPDIQEWLDQYNLAVPDIVIS
jgi:hypothetical protein